MSPSPTRCPARRRICQTFRRTGLSIAVVPGGSTPSASERTRLHRRRRSRVELRRHLPTLPLGVEGGLLARFEGGVPPASRPSSKRGSRAAVEAPGFSRPRRDAPRGKSSRSRSSSSRADRVEADLIEEAQQPRLAVLESPRSRASGSTSAPCGRRTDSRPGPPCRRRRGRRRRCRRHSPASRCAPGCTSS